MTIGERLRGLRERHEWSQEEVARKINTSVSLIGRYERNERLPPPDKLNLLCDLYGVGADYLLGLIDDPAPADRQRKLTPAEQLAEMGLGTVFARGGDITEADVEFFRAYLETQRRLREKGKGGPKGK